MSVQAGRPSPGPVEARPASLTARQGEVARLIARGLSNRRIAAALALSGRTVEWHVANVLKNLGLESRVQLAIWAAGRGLAVGRRRRSVETR